MAAKITIRSLRYAAAFALTASAEEPAALTQDDMQKMLSALRADFSVPGAVSYEALNRAAVDGLLKANPRTMQLVQKGEAPQAGKLLSEVLAEGIAAARPSGFSPEELKALRESLTKLAAETKNAALVLDLRVPCPDAGPSAAAELLSMLLPAGTALFTAGTPVTSAGDPVWTGEVIALVDEESTNTAEIAAAVLKATKRAWIIGSQTRGRLSAVKELALRDGRVLRYTTQPVQIAGMEDLFGKGLTPDQTVAFDAERKRAAFTVQQAEGLALAIFLQPRPRQNEAALQTKENVEIPDRVLRSGGKSSPFDTAPADRAMQAAVDVLTARRVLTPPAK